MTRPTQSSDSMYRLLVQGVTDYAIYMLGLDGTVSSWNAGAQTFKGYQANEIIGEHFSRFYTEADRATGLPVHALRTAREQGRFEGEGWRVRKDGTQFWAHVVIDLVKDEQGQEIGFAKITRDTTAQREASRRAGEQERNFRLLVQGVTDYAIYMLSLDGTVSNWNAGAERAKGYRADEIVGKHFSQFYLPEERAKGMPQRALATARAKGKFEGEGWRLRKDGTRFWAHVVLHPIFDEEGTQIGFAKITRDLTQFRRQMDEVRTAKENLHLALSNMSQGLCLFDAREQLTLCNARFYEITGLEEEAIRPGATFVDVLWAMYGGANADPDTVAEQVRVHRERHLEGLLRGDGMTAQEEVWRDRTISTSHRRLSEGGWVSTIEDVTERKRIESTIVHLAHHDVLTEMLNRVAFREHVEGCLWSDVPCALLYLDLDRFKPVNDTLGHSVGDRVLRTVAERIGNELRKEDVGCRLGGDEFAVLLMGCDTRADAARVADRLIREIGRAIVVDEVEVNVGLSVGIAFRGEAAGDADLLLRNADLALYAAKRDGRGCHREYEPGMENQLQQRRDLERDLREAISRDELFLQYQPVVDVEHNAVTSFEALLRWNSATRGLVSPVDFIPFAEEIGLMPEIGDWVLRTACREAATWDEQIVISVNLSPKQFAVPNLAERVGEVLRETGLPPKRLELEVTETAMIGDLEHARGVLSELRALGIHIAMDDFGTGYSSLTFLRNLPFTRIKIDRSFIKDLGKSPEALAILRAVTSLCDGLGVAATAEGVETEEQLTILRREGCPEAQGYLIKRPMPATDTMRWLSEYRTADEQIKLVMVSA